MTLRTLATATVLIFAASVSAAAQPRVTRAKKPRVRPKQASRTLGTRLEERPAPAISVTESLVGPEATPNITIRILGDAPAKSRKPMRTAESQPKPTIRMTIASPTGPVPTASRAALDQPGHLPNDD
jgi:hypothetical protein